MNRQFRKLVVLFLLVSSIYSTAYSQDTGKKKDTPTPVSVENTPNVNVVGTPQVIVANASNQPIPVTTIQSITFGREPFQIWFPFTAFGVNPAQVSISVPGNRRLVLEGITVYGTMTSVTQIQDLSVTTTVSSSIYSFAVPHRLSIPNAVPQVATPTSLFFSANYPVRYYADPGTVVRLSLFAGSSAFGQGSVQVTFSGYLIPIDSPSLAP